MTVGCVCGKAIGFPGIAYGLVSNPKPLYCFECCPETDHSKCAHLYRKDEIKE